MVYEDDTAIWEPISMCCSVHKDLGLNVNSNECAVTKKKSDEASKDKM
jgi:hypothetical protein